LRQELLSSCNLHTILDCPSGKFIGRGKTVVLFEKGKPFDCCSGNAFICSGKPLNQAMATQKIWYYQLDPGRNMGKINSLNDEDLREFEDKPGLQSRKSLGWWILLMWIGRRSICR
jgi:type I restriction enzyme M protein